jgi:hypothetical protein
LFEVSDHRVRLAHPGASGSRDNNTTTTSGISVVLSGVLQKYG